MTIIEATLPMNFSPLSFSPVGEMQVTLTIDNRLIIRHKSICPSPSGEARWGLSSIAGVICSFPLGRLGWV